MKLEWSHKYSLEELLRLDKDAKKEFWCPGVYIWLRPISRNDKKMIISYVGKSQNLWIRQWEHYRLQIGGLYTIPKGFREGDKEWWPSWKDKGEPTREEYMDNIFNLEQIQEIVKDGYALSQTYRVYLCSIIKEEEKTIINNIERNLLYDLQPEDTIWGTGSPPKEKLDLVHENAEWLEGEDIQSYLKDNERIVKSRGDGYEVTINKTS